MITLYDGLKSLLTQYRSRHLEYLDEASDRQRTQEYRTWHHIMARTLGPVVDDLDRLLARDNAEKELISLGGHPCGRDHLTVRADQWPSAWLCARRYYGRSRARCKLAPVKRRRASAPRSERGYTRPSLPPGVGL